MSLSRGILLGPYEIIAPLGAGAMGEVYKARDTKLCRDIAIKVLPDMFASDPERLARFQREAQLLASLNHQNIAQVYGLEEAGEVRALAMELVDGPTLAEVISGSRGRAVPSLTDGPAGRPIPIDQALSIARQIAAALEAAHQQGIIHRDLKPANIMVRPDGAVKVLDFGLARLAQSVATADETVMQTAAGRILGTPAYMAPEQWEGQAADARSDIYAFGCILYEMLTATRVAQPRRPVPSHSLESIVSKCLERHPADRWQSAAELGRRLAQAQNPRTYWREMGIAAAAVIILALGGVIWWQQSPQAKPLTDKDVLVLADFTNTTGDPVFDGTLRQGLAIQLEQSPFLKTLDDEVMRQDLRLMGRPPGEPMTIQIAHDICVREGAAATIGGSIASLGTSYVITLQAVTCQTGATLAREQAQAENKERVLQAVGTAATAMRAKLGESLASIEKSTGPLGQFTTSSLEALQTYAMGYALQSQGQFLKAIPFFERATELDPNFAVAYLLLSIAYNNAGDLARSNEYQRKAFSLVDRVSEFERLFISARYYWHVTGELNKAIDLGGLLARSYPRYWGVHSELSVLYRTIGQFEKALEEGQEAIRLAPRLEPPYRNQASAYARLDRLSEARQVLAKARAQQLDGPRLHQRLLEIAYIEGDETAAEREIQWYAGKPEEYFSFGAQAANAAALGQRRKAGELYGRARETALRRGLAGLAAEFDEADALVQALMGYCQPTRHIGGPALALALCGDVSRAEKLAAEISSRFPNLTIWNAVQLPTIRAAIELGRGQPAKAIEFLASARPYERAYPDAVYLRGLAYARLRQSSEAMAEFRKIADHKGASWALDGSGPTLAKALIHSLSYPAWARAAALSGDTAAARKAYQDFLMLWKNADADLPVLAEVHKELAALK